MKDQEIVRFIEKAIEELKKTPMMSTLHMQRMLLVLYQVVLMIVKSAVEK